MRRRLGNTEKGETRSAARRQIGRPRSIAAASLEAQSITQAEQATNSTDDRVLASGPTNPERAVDTSHVKDNAVTGRIIAADAVDTAQLKINSVTNARLAADAVDTAQMRTGSVTRIKIGANAVGGSELAGGSVADSHIAGRLGKGTVPPDTVYGNAQGKLAYADIIDKPSLAQYLTRNEADRLYAGNAQSVNNPNHHKHG